MELTWYSNAVVKVRGERASIIFDPFFGRNPELRKFHLDDLAGVDAVLLTHGHFDHAADIPAIARDRALPVFAPKAVCENLRKRHGVPSERLHAVENGESFSVGDLRILPLKARHVHFDTPLVLDTAAQIIRGFSRTKSLLWKGLKEHRRFPMGACMAWQVATEGKSLLHFGSLALDEKQLYPTGTDILSLPFQGNSRVAELSFNAVRRLRPRSAYLHHFDDAFPPISRFVDPQPFADLMRAELPEIPVHIPEYRKPMKF